MRDDANHHAEKLAVLDIGSNSVRFVVFSSLIQVEMPVYNEKFLCGLGRGIDQQRNLDPAAKELTLRVIARFAALARGMNVSHIEAIATAALRDCSEGPAFAAQLGEIIGVPVQILTGAEEARLSAIGVLAGIPQARGMVGDLGGGSLELLRITSNSQTDIGSDFSFCDPVTLAVGPLRLLDEVGSDLIQAQRIIEQQFDQLNWPVAANTDSYYTGAPLYSVGGAWRAIARFHMRLTKAPLPVVHQYTVDGAELGSVCQQILSLSPDALNSKGWVSGKRVRHLPQAALVLQQLVIRLRPRSVVFCATGLREGIAYNRLDPELQFQDSLIKHCAILVENDNRFGPLGAELIRFTDPLFHEAEETPAWRRLRAAACHLSDWGWKLHPQGRASVSFERIIMAPFFNLNHQDRAFLALTIYAGYGGKIQDPILAPAQILLSSQAWNRALLLAAIFRLAYAISGRVPALLAQASLIISSKGAQPGKVVLKLPKHHAVLRHDLVEKRLIHLNLAKKKFFSK